jgi:hypothetical protein
MTKETACAALSLVASVIVGCARSVPAPPPAADSGCIQTCQQTHALCLQGTNTPSHAYGEPGAALIGGLIQYAVAQSGRSRCAETLQGCYASCGTTVTTQEATLVNLCARHRCADGKPGLWIGRANSQGFEVAIGVYLCADGNQVTGEWGCAPLMPAVGCVTAGGAMQGEVTGETLKLTSSPLPGGQVDRCDFTARLVGTLQLGGEYECIGKIKTTGTFAITRCP